MGIGLTDLLGAWRLVGWSLVYADGRPPEYPLGQDAVGFLMYTPDAHVSATLMRKARPPQAPASAADAATAYADSFAYAGRFAVRDDSVFHTIEVATNPALVGVTSTRNIELAGDILALSGPDFGAGGPRSQRIVWRRGDTAA